MKYYYSNDVYRNQMFLVFQDIEIYLKCCKYCNVLLDLETLSPKKRKCFCDFHCFKRHQTRKNWEKFLLDEFEF